MLLLFHRIKCDKSYIYDNHITKQIWTAEFRAVVRLHDTHCTWPTNYSRNAHTSLGLVIFCFMQCPVEALATKTGSAMLPSHYGPNQYSRGLPVPYAQPLRQSKKN